MRKNGATFWDFILELLDYPVIQFAVVVLALTAMCAVIGLVVPR